MGQPVCSYPESFPDPSGMGCSASAWLVLPAPMLRAVGTNGSQNDSWVSLGWALLGWEGGEVPRRHLLKSR